MNANSAASLAENRGEAMLPLLGERRSKMILPPLRTRTGWRTWAASLVLILVSLALPLRAQVQVDITLERNLFILGEVIPVTVTVTNLTGNDLDLIDSGINKWFGFDVTSADGRPLPPRDGDYVNPPVQLGAGQKITRTVNITPLFPVDEFGSYRVRACIYLAQGNRFCKSPTLNFDVTEGLQVWQKTVGVPDGFPGAGGTRTVTLLIHHLPQSKQLYLRIEDTQGGLRKCMHKLGRILTSTIPDVQLDNKNRIHVLQNNAPKVFLYSSVGLEGEVLDRKSFNEMATRPSMHRTADGSIQIVGGELYDPTAKPAEQTLPSLSDRPVPLPGIESKPAPDDKRPENLLSR